MERMIKIGLMLVLILILGIGFSLETYAAINCKVSMSSPEEIIQGEELEVTIGIADIQGEKGVLIFGGTIEYDTDVLTYIGKSEEGNWSISYNKTNGKFVADRDDGFATSNEYVFKLKFKVKENAEGKATITVKNALVSDAQGEADIGEETKTVAIKVLNNDNTNQGEKPNGDNKPNLDNQPTTPPTTPIDTPSTIPPTTPTDIPQTTPTISNDNNKKTDNNIINNNVIGTELTQNNEINEENTNHIVNTLDNQNTITNTMNDRLDRNKEVKEETKSNATILYILVISTIIVFAIIIAIFIYIQKRKR